MPGTPQGDPPAPKATAVVEARQGEVTHWAEPPQPSRGLLEPLALTLPPLHILATAPQTSAQVASPLQTMGAALAA
jgi:hypothetical protein